MGVSFSPRRAAAQGLDWRLAFRRLLDLELSPIRLAVFWDEIDRAGYGDLDWLLAAAEGARRDVLLTTGIKAQGWPEFYMPARLMPRADRGADVTAANPGLCEAALELMAVTVDRYRRQAAVVAWQVENEPLNASGPHRWWIGLEFLRAEIAVVRQRDPGRPVVLNVFSRFNPWVDAASRRSGTVPRRLRGSRAGSSEADTLALLNPGDILGLDVYRRIGVRRLGVQSVTRAWGWRWNAERWLRRAEAEGKRAWIVEAQAEPWHGPRTCRPEDVAALVIGLRDAGYDTILLWGAEHWLARRAGGDPSWLAAVERLIRERPAC